jgi:hypothetical protein
MENFMQNKKFDPFLPPCVICGDRILKIHSLTKSFYKDGQYRCVTHDGVAQEKKKADERFHEFMKSLGSEELPN